LNPLDKSNYGTAPTNGNLSVLSSVNFVEDRFVGTIAVNSGKWYFETTITGTLANTQIGIHDANSAASTPTMYRTYVSGGSKQSGGTTSAYGNSFTTNDVIGVAVDMDSGRIWFSKNGTYQASGDPVAGTNAAFTDLSGTITPFAVYYQTDLGTSGHNLNFGQRPFAYTAPSGFRALNTQNLPTPTIGATPATQAGKFFNPVIYTGDGVNGRTVGGVGFQPDLVWIKNRNSSAYWHTWIDSVRGADRNIWSNSTAAEQLADPNGSVGSFVSDGFTAKAGSTGIRNTNGSSEPYVSWNWKANGAGVTNTAGSITSTVSANTTSGFSVATFTTPSSGAFTFGHGLGAAPAMVIAKARATAGFAWVVYHRAIGPTKYLALNGTGTPITLSSVWNDTAPTSTVVSSTAAGLGASQTYVAYCFAEVPGYSRFGSYVGNGSADGAFVFCGFRPAYIMVRRITSGGGDWLIIDVSRSPTNVMDDYLEANTANTEGTTSLSDVDFLSNGFKWRTAQPDRNGSGDEFVFMAFASAPQKFALAR
jgi:hypothetical protein